MAVEQLGPPQEFPGFNFPTVFADGVMNIANSPHVAKMYLFRFEPSFVDANRYQQQPVAQVVMPLEAVVVMATFLERSITNLVTQGVLTKERVEEIKNARPPGK